METWRVVGRCDRYEVSDLGRVRNRATQRVLRPTQNHKQDRPGYLKVCLGRSCQVYVHQLVAEAFLGPPRGRHVDHVDFDRANNALSNLRYLAPLDNAFRWKDRVDGRNVWASPYLDGDDPPEDHEPLSEEEAHELERDLAAAGW